jgi:poly(hydroxyalkanoate) depolymerase family esterase
MLHGCGQDAERFARSTRMHRLAAVDRFLVLYPEQERLANPQGCWNWFEMRSGRALSEAASIIAAIDQACTVHGADPTRVAIAGLSAGASMAALLAACYPQRFKAVAMHSGVGPGAAYSTATALSAMHGRRSPGPLPKTEGAEPPPPLLVIQGTADHIVNAANAHAAAQQWAEAWDAEATEPRTLQRGARYLMTQTDFKHDGRVVVSLCEVEGLGHAWSGGATGQSFSEPKGPGASRLIWAFAQRQFRRG